MNGPPIIREVVEEASVSQVLYAEKSLYPRLEEAFNAVVWRLARTPEYGYLVDENYWIYKQEGSREIKVPGILVLYTFDRDHVNILFLQVCVPTI